MPIIRDRLSFVRREASSHSDWLELAARLRRQDEPTGRHSERSAHLALALARSLRLSDDDVWAVWCGAQLHDVGKLGISRRLLQKPAALTRREFAIVQQHTVIGEGLCGSDPAMAAVRAIVRSHHERMDGSGYPDRLRGDAVPILAQIIAVADVFDALTSDRPYRKAWSTDAALGQLLRESDLGRLRHDLVDTLADVLPCDIADAREDSIGVPAPLIHAGL